VQLAAVIGGVAAGAALVASLLFLAWQVRLANQLAEAKAVAAFYEANDRAVVQFLAYPELYRYFYDNAELEDDLTVSSAPYVQAMSVAELFADSIESSYVAIATSLLTDSPVFRQFVSDNAAWYAHLAEELEEVQARAPVAAPIAAANQEPIHQDA
jgi:hypothetical protein